MAQPKAPAITPAPAALASLEQELAQLTQEAEREKATSYQAADRRAALLERQATLASEAARLQKILDDDAHRAAYEEQQAEARRQGVLTTERQAALAVATAERQGCLVEVERRTADLCTALTAALAADRTHERARTLLRTGRDDDNGTAYLRMRRRLAGRVAHLLRTDGGLGAALEHATPNVLRGPLAEETPA